MCHEKPSHKERLFRGVLLPLEEELRIVHMLQDDCNQHKRKIGKEKKRVRGLGRFKKLSHIPSSRKCTLPNKYLA